MHIFFRQSFPKHEFIGEETVAAANGKIETFTENPTWIIDPIDGTMNFVHSNPLVTISVALAINKKIVLGIVSAPCIGKTFTAIKGQGCKLNGQNIKVSECKELKLAQCILEVWPDMKETIQNHNFATIGNVCSLDRHIIQLFGITSLKKKKLFLDNKKQFLLRYFLSFFGPY